MSLNLLTKEVVISSPPFTVGRRCACVSGIHSSSALGLAPGVLISSLNPESQVGALLSVTVPYLSFYSACGLSPSRFTLVHMQSPTIPSVYNLLYPRKGPGYPCPHDGRSWQWLVALLRDRS